MLCVVCCMLVSFVSCCAGVMTVPFVVVRGWLLFGIRCGWLLRVDNVWRCLLYADDFVLVIVVACRVLLLFAVVWYMVFMIGCCCLWLCCFRCYWLLVGRWLSLVNG